MTYTKRNTQIASHRGGAGLWAENSIIAFKNTAKLNVDFVEFDIHPTLDNQLVVFHDATLDRMTNGTGEVSAKSFAELQMLNIKETNGEKIPLLDDVIKIFLNTNISLRLEIKGDANGECYQGIEKKIISELSQHNALEGTVITSFLIEALKELQTLNTPCHLLWLVKREILRNHGIAHIINTAKQHSINEIALGAELITPQIIKACKESNIILSAYGAHNEDNIRQMFKFGVSAFTTDFPDLALEISNERCS